MQERPSVAYKSEYRSATARACHARCRVKQPQATIRIGTSSRVVVDQLKKFAVLDEGSHIQAVHRGLLLPGRDSLAGVLRGLFTADGTVANYGANSQFVALDSTSLELLRQTQLMLLSFGIKSKLYRDRRRGRYDVKRYCPTATGARRSTTLPKSTACGSAGVHGFIFEREIGFMAGSPKAEQLARLNREVTTYADRLEDRVESLGVRWR